MKKVFLVFDSDFKDKHIIKELLEQKKRNPNDNNYNRPIYLINRSDILITYNIMNNLGLLNIEII